MYSKNTKRILREYSDSGKKLLFSPRTNVEVASVDKNSSSEKSGILPGDMLLSINGVETEFFDDFRASPSLI